MTTSSYYPVFINVRQEKCLVVGGGEVALRKVQALLEHGAEVQVISPALCPELNQLARNKRITVLPREYKPGDLTGIFLTIAATDDRETNHKVAAEAKRLRIMINVVDDPEQSNFIVPACLYRGDLTIAVSTAGGSPALARKIKSRLEQVYGQDYSALLDLVKEVRGELKKQAITITGDDWQKALDLDVLIELLRNGQREKAKAILWQNLETYRE